MNKYAHEAKLTKEIGEFSFLKAKQSDKQAGGSRYRTKTIAKYKAVK